MVAIPTMSIALCLQAAAMSIGAPQVSRRIRQRAVPSRRWIKLALVVAVLLCALMGRALVLLSAAVLGLLVSHLVRSRRQQRRHLAQQQCLSTLANLIVADLQAGIAPTQALQQALTHAKESHTLPAHQEVFAVFEAGLRASRFGTAVAPHLLAHAQIPSLRIMAQAWDIAEQHGIALAPMLGLARRQIDTALRHQQHTQAALQGPATTAVVLSILPLLGMALARLMGTNTVSFLLGTATGNVLLFGGTLCLCAGAWWSQRIMQHASGEGAS